MAGAQIKFTQGGTIGTAGRALQGVAGTAVTAANALNDGTILRSVWTLVGAPSASALVPSIEQDGAGASWVFTPDVPGVYEVLVEAYTSLAPGATPAYTDERAFVVPEATGRVIPAFDSSGGPLPGHSGSVGSLNLGGDTRGWFPFMEVWLKLLDLLAYNVAAKTGNATLDPHETLVPVNSAGACTITLGDATLHAGEHHLIVDVSGAAGTHAITIAVQAGQHVNGVPTATLQADRGIAHVVSDGTQWLLLYLSPNKSPIALSSASGSLQLTNDMAGRTIYLDTIAGGGLAGNVLLPTAPYAGMRMAFKDPNDNGWSTTAPTIEDATPHDIEDPIALGTFPGNTIAPGMPGGSFIIEYDSARARWNQVSGG